MNKMIISTLLLLSVLDAHDISVTITDIKNHTGKLYIGLYNKKSGFREVDKTYKKFIVDISSNKVTYIFDNVPTDIYALSVFHDENNNGIHDKNILGIPTEDYGFSNNKKHLFGPASFEESSFQIENNKNITITLGD